MKVAALITSLSLAILPCAAAVAQTDPLPSWNAGPVKSSITEFVARVTTPASADYVPPAERIAVFDNDGTLWPEQPIYFQLAFAFDRIRALAPQHPEWRQQQPFKALIEGDVATALAGGREQLEQVLAITHAGLTVDEFHALAAEWVATARHPRFGRPYGEVIYEPMGELLRYLRANGFKTFIVSGGGVEFMRPWTERVYGIPPEQVVGSSGIVRFDAGPEGTATLTKEARIEFINDGPGKPVGINRFIGRRPIFAFGNSDGDLQMLQYAAGAEPSFMGLVRHTDAEREYAYDRQSSIGKLDRALDEATTRGWTVVDMRRDWNRVFAFEAASRP
jgi:hypothetical protein